MSLRYTATLREPRKETNINGDTSNDAGFVLRFPVSTVGSDIGPLYTAVGEHSELTADATCRAQ